MSILRVAVNDVRGIVLPFATMSHDVYVVVSSGGTTQQTDLCECADGMAIWDEVFDVPLAQDWPRFQQLLVQVFHRGTVNMMRPLGQVAIPLSFLRDKENMRDCRYHTLVKVDDDTRPVGALKLEMCVMNGFPAHPAYGGDPYGSMYGQAPGMGYQQPPQASLVGTFDHPQSQPQQPGFLQPQPPELTRQRSAPPPNQQKAVVLQAGAMLDNKYRVEKLLGKGNFGTAYLAKSEVDDQRYAVKLILCKQESELQTIKSEAKILFQMLHDNIVRYFSSFIHIDHLGQKYFGMVMEYCENKDIQSHINHYKSRHTRVSDRRIARWTLEIAEALAYMHAKGLQHRDLKADNVMVRGEKAKVADFGLATAKGSLLGQVGALAYESPEQANHLPYDGRNDIWALGCLVTEMLTGKMVFRRVKPGVVFALQPEVVEATIAECAQVSPDWGRLVAWLLNVDVTLRPTAEFVCETLRPIVEELYKDPSPATASPKRGGEGGSPLDDAAGSGGANSGSEGSGEGGGGAAADAGSETSEDGPPPEYSPPAQATLKFPEVVMEPVPAPTKLEVDDRASRRSSATGPVLTPSSNDGAGREGIGSGVRFSSPRTSGDPASGARRQPPPPPPQLRRHISAPPPPLGNPNHRSPWMDDVEMALVTFYSKIQQHEAMQRIGQKIEDVRTGRVTLPYLEQILKQKYGEAPELSKIQVTYPRTIEVTVPAECGPGSGLAVQSPHTGRELTVKVPQGLQPGMTMNIIEEVPAVAQQPSSLAGY